MLIIFEGLHSAGKSTQARMLADWLETRGVVTVRTSWNSSVPLGATITDLKIRDRLGPQAMVLMEAADLAYRYETGLKAALEAGHVVISDRYHFSTIARGVIRGLQIDHIEDLFRFAPKPTLVFHVRCTGSETMRRRVEAGQSLGSHLSGADYRAVSNERDAFVGHQNEMASLYESLLPHDAVILPCDTPVDKLHNVVVEAYMALASAH